MPPAINAQEDKISTIQDKTVTRQWFILRCWLKFYKASLNHDRHFLYTVRNLIAIDSCGIRIVVILLILSFDYSDGNFWMIDRRTCDLFSKWTLRKDMDCVRSVIESGYSFE